MTEINWPDTFAERGIGTVLHTAWEESAPGCWFGVEGISGAQHAVVVDDASGLVVAAPYPPGAPPPTPQRWFVMADALAEMMRQRGYAVTCAAEACEYRRWPCPVRTAYAVTTPYGPPAGETADATHHRPVSAGRIEVTDG